MLKSISLLALFLFCTSLLSVSTDAGIRWQDSEIEETQSDDQETDEQETDNQETGEPMQNEQETTGEQGTSRELDPIEIRMDMEGPVIVYDTMGGYRRRDPEGFEREPVLQVFADGRVISGANNPLLGHSEWQLNEEELSELLRLIVTTHRFYESNTDEISETIRATGRRVGIMDASTTLLTVDLERGTHSVDVYALGFVAQDYPEVNSLERLDAIEKRLKQLRHRTVLGDNADTILAASNEEFEKQFPGLGSFGIESLVSAYKLVDGAIKVNFDAEINVENNADAEASVRKFRVIYQLAGENEEPAIAINEFKAATGG